MRWLATLSLLLCIAPAASANLSLGILTDEPAPMLAGLLSQRLAEELTIEVREFPDANALKTAIAEGALDLAFIEEPVGDIPGSAIVSELYPSVLHVIAHDALPAESLADILGSSHVWAGFEGGTAHTLAKQLAGDYQIDGLNLLPDPWSTEPTVYFVFGGILARDALSRLGDYRLYSLDSVASPERGSIAEGIALRYPNLRSFVLPAEVYPTLSSDAALTLAVSNLLIARSSLEEEVVYTLAMAVERLRPEIAALYPLARLEALDRRVSVAHALPLHAGAQRFADRDKPGWLERYAELAGVVLTALFGITTIGIALHRRQKQARKDRLDTYYQQVLDLRFQLGAGDQAPERVAAELASLQAEVFHLVITERVDADSALLAFVDLSNQLLREAESRR